MKRSRRLNDWYFSCITSNWWNVVSSIIKIASFVEVACSFTAGIIVYLKFNLNETSVFVQTLSFCLNPMTQLIGIEDEK